MGNFSVILTHLLFVSIGFFHSYIFLSSPDIDLIFNEWQWRLINIAKMIIKQANIQFGSKIKLFSTFYWFVEFVSETYISEAKLENIDLLAPAAMIYHEFWPSSAKI